MIGLTQIEWRTARQLFGFPCPPWLEPCPVLRLVPKFLPTPQTYISVFCHNIFMLIWLSTDLMCNYFHELNIRAKWVIWQKKIAGQNQKKKKKNFEYLSSIIWIVGWPECWATWANWHNLPFVVHMSIHNLHLKTPNYTWSYLVKRHNRLYWDIYSFQTSDLLPSTKHIG